MKIGPGHAKPIVSLQLPNNSASSPDQRAQEESEDENPGKGEEEMKKA
jgi:hypothetical protein